MYSQTASKFLTLKTPNTINGTSTQVKYHDREGADAVQALCTLQGSVSWKHS